MKEYSELNRRNKKAFNKRNIKEQKQNDTNKIQINLNLPSEFQMYKN